LILIVTTTIGEKEWLTRREIHLAGKKEETKLEGARAQNPAAPKVKSTKTIVGTSDDHDSLTR
jgi:hypothetical protein